MLLLAAAVGVLSCGSKDSGEISHSIGGRYPDIDTAYMLSERDARYLGVAADRELSISAVAGELLIIEVLNVYCSNCRKQAPIMAELYHAIQSRPDLESRIKILAIASGNQEWEIDFFKKLFDVPYPMVPDAELAISTRLGITKTPIHFALKKSEGHWIVATDQQSSIDSSHAYIKELAGLLNQEAAAEPRVEKEGATRSVKPPDELISEEHLLELIMKGLRTDGWQVRNVEEVELDNREIVYAAKLDNGNASKNLFAKVVFRETICDTCEDVHFIYVFDEQGRITALVPILLGKDDNEPWDQSDLEFTQRRILGKYIGESFEFDARVDAVSTATVTSYLIFDSLDRAISVYQELKEKGYIH